MAESLIEVKTRIASTKKTHQITKAMHMVSSSKVKKSEKTYKRYQDFMHKIGDLVATVLAQEMEEVHPMLKPREVKKVAYLLISSDTGLAGSYNSSIFKHFEKITEGNKDNIILGTIGRKAFAYGLNHHYELLNDSAIFIRDDVMFLDIVPLTKKFIDLYLSGEIDKLVIIYNHYVNSLTIEIKDQVLLPLSEIEGNKLEVEYLFEGGVMKALNELLPMYLEAMVYGIILDAKTAEHSSRMNAMKAATDNASEIIDKLQIVYNRARQAAITTELTDIIAGANAVN